MKTGKLLLQMLLTLGLAFVLGLVFNNANPLGLREGQRPAPVEKRAPASMRSNSAGHIGSQLPYATNSPPGNR